MRFAHGGSSVGGASEGHARGFEDETWSPIPRSTGSQSPRYAAPTELPTIGNVAPIDLAPTEPCGLVAQMPFLAVNPAIAGPTRLYAVLR